MERCHFLWTKLLIIAYNLTLGILVDSDIEVGQTLSWFIFPFDSALPLCHQELGPFLFKSFSTCLMLRLPEG
jgi:hypothetical protein